jgi:hypothetical protein
MTMLVAIIPSVVLATSSRSDRAREAAHMKRSPITVKIQVRQRMVEGQRRVLVDFEFKNPTKGDEELEKWLALDPPLVEIALLQIEKADGSPIPYVGRHINRGGVGKEGYLRLSSGASRVVRGVDVTAVYDWPATPQRLTVRYDALSIAHGGLRILSSTGQQLDYVPP